jgi:iron-sulfur cluster assembly protein
MSEFDTVRLARHGGKTATNRKESTVLTLTDNAATEIRNLVAHPDVPDEGGVRIASNTDGALTLAIAAGPADGDEVVEDAGARVFLESDAGSMLDDKTLDAGVDPEGHLQFAIAVKE